MGLADRALAIRRNVIAMAAARGDGYAGQGLGVADILAALYFGEMRYRATEPQWPGRDRFLLSIGHYSIALFAAMAEAGIISVDSLPEYGLDGARLAMSTVAGDWGVEMTGGSLGQGLGVACGRVLAARLRGEDHRVFVLVSDGELQEGSTWEAAAFAGHHRLGRLVCLVDVNRTQADGDLGAVQEVEPVAEKFRAFGWTAVDVAGNDVNELAAELAVSRDSGDPPRVLVCHTRLGNGVRMVMERPRAHFVTLSEAEWEAAVDQLEGTRGG